MIRYLIIWTTFNFVLHSWINIINMKCVVCERAESEIKLVSLLKNKSCGSCKTAYYRALIKLHEYVDENTDSSKLLSLDTCQCLTWEFLCSHKFCIQKRPLVLNKLCDMEIGLKSQIACAHCRFRKTFFALRSIARTKIVSRDPRSNNISKMLHMNSDMIVGFCVKKLFGEREKNDKAEYSSTISTRPNS